jgi:hypothetical protein
MTEPIVRKFVYLTKGYGLWVGLYPVVFFYPKSPDTPWGRWGFESLDTTEAALYVSEVVQRVVIPTPFGKALQGYYKRKIVGRFGQEDLLYTYAGGAKDFGTGSRFESEWGKLDKAVRTGGWGLIHWAGHGGGRIIAFPDDSPNDPIYLFGLGWGSWKCINITTFPQGYLRAVKVVYLGGCNTCTDEFGGGLPQAFVDKGGPFSRWMACVQEKPPKREHWT